MRWLILPLFAYRIEIWKISVFVEEKKLEYPENNSHNKDENRQQTKHGVASEIRTRATLVRCECPHHCAIPVPQEYENETYL